MLRLDLLAYIVASHGSILAEAGVAVTDTAGALKEPLDRTMRALGVDEADLATAPIGTTDVPAALALADYWTLERASRALSGNFDLSSGATSLRLSQIKANVLKDLERAEALVVRFLGSVFGASAVAVGAGVVTTGTIDFGILSEEPA